MAEPTESTGSTIVDPTAEETTLDQVHAPPPTDTITEEPDSDHHAPPQKDEVHGGDDASSSSSSASSSSSESENEKEEVKEKKPKVYRLFGREKPLHQVLGGGKPAEVLLWRNKKISAGALGAATAIYVLFEIMEYHLLTLLCHILILLLSVLFLWSNVTTIIHKSPPRIPDIHLPGEPFHDLVIAVSSQINWVFSALRDVAAGKDLKKFLMVVAGLWVLSVVGNWCSFLTLFYTAFVILHTVPVLYEKYENKVDSYGEKAAIEMKKHYAVLDEKVLSKIPKGLLKVKKKD